MKLNRGLGIHCRECENPVAADASVCTSCQAPTVLYEPVWVLRRDHDTWVCELEYLGERGVEVHILHNDSFRISQRFNTRGSAALWAEGERRVLDAGPDDYPFPNGISMLQTRKSALASGNQPSKRHKRVGLADPRL